MVGETARQEVARTRMTLGLALYHGGGIGAAVTNWELALAEDPSQIYPLFFLVRGYYDLGRYPAGIAAAERLAKLIKHPFLRPRECIFRWRVTVMPN